MSRQPHYDDLDEMLVPKELQKAEKEKAAKKAGVGTKKTAKERKAEQKKQEQRQTILTVVVIFVVLLALVIGIGVAMSKRVEPQGQNSTSQSAKVEKAQPDPDKTAFRSESNIPVLSDEGVKGLLKEAYYTVDGDLAVTLNLSNGTTSKHKLAKVGIRIFNGEDETVAQQTIDKFDPECYVEAGGYGEVYFLINKEYVVLSNDPLEKLGTTLEIGSIPTDAKATVAGDKDNGPVVGKGDKDIAAGRSFYENTGNIPAMASDGIKATVIRARYTNDGSLAVTLSLSNGTSANQRVESMQITIKNGGGDVIADSRLTGIDHTVPTGSYNELHLILDKADVRLSDDPLSTLSTIITVNPGA